MYYYWLVLAATLLFNFLACLFGLFGGRGV
jgi:hypothetical protein